MEMETDILKKCYGKFMTTPCFDNRAKSSLVLKCMQELEDYYLKKLVENEGKK